MLPGFGFLWSNLRFQLNSVIRIHESAVAGAPIGRLDANELRAIGERLAEHLDLDIQMLIESKARELLQRIAARSQPDAP